MPARCAGASGGVDGARHGMGVSAGCIAAAGHRNASGHGVGVCASSLRGAKDLVRRADIAWIDEESVVASPVVPKNAVVVTSCGSGASAKRTGR